MTTDGEREGLVRGLETIEAEIMKISGVSSRALGPRIDRDGIPIPDGIQSGYAMSMLVRGTERARRIAESLTTREVAEVVLGLDEKSIETFVEALPDEQAAAFTVRASAIRAAFALAAKVGERSLAIRGYLGQKYTDNGTTYLFTDSQRKKWKDIPGMVASLEEQGISVYEVLRSISEMRVTDLRTLTDSKHLSDEQRAEALRIIEDFRESVPSAPGFVELDERGRIKRG